MSPAKRGVIAAGATALYLFAIVLPNLLIEHYGIVDVAPGPWVLMAPAAVYAVGLALVARDVVDEALGHRTLLMLGLIIVGSVISAVVADPKIAFASFAAFALSECLDLGIYRGLRDSGWAIAALVSSLIGAGLDSLVFLWLAFGSLDFLAGQWVGKAVAIVLVVIVFAPLRRFWAPSSRTEHRHAVAA